MKGTSMRISHGLLAGALSLAGLTSGSLAQAGPISISFAGQIDSVIPAANGALAQVKLGDPFAATFQVDPDRATARVVGDDVFFDDVILEGSLLLQVGPLAF